MRKYEVVFIIRPMEEEATNAVIEKFSNLIVANGGTIDKEDRWGKKKNVWLMKLKTALMVSTAYLNTQQNQLALQNLIV